jgi:hypothetical protein
MHGQFGGLKRSCKDSLTKTVPTEERPMRRYTSLHDVRSGLNVLFLPEKDKPEVTP